MSAISEFERQVWLADEYGDAEIASGASRKSLDAAGERADGARAPRSDRATVCERLRQVEVRAFEKMQSAMQAQINERWPQLLANKAFRMGVSLPLPGPGAAA